MAMAQIETVSSMCVPKKCVTGMRATNVVIEVWELGARVFSVTFAEASQAETQLGLCQRCPVLRAGKPDYSKQFGIAQYVRNLSGGEAIRYKVVAI